MMEERNGLSLRRSFLPFLSFCLVVACRCNYLWKREEKREKGLDRGEGVYGPRIDISRRDLRFTGNNPISRERCGVGANDESWPAGPPTIASWRCGRRAPPIKGGPFSLSLFARNNRQRRIRMNDKSRSILSSSANFSPPDKSFVKKKEAITISIVRSFCLSIRDAFLYKYFLGEESIFRLYF